MKRKFFQEIRKNPKHAFLIFMSMSALLIFSLQSLKFTHQGFVMILHDKAPVGEPGISGLLWTAGAVQMLYAVVVMCLGASPQRPLLWLFTVLMAAMSMFGSLGSLYNSLVGDELAAVAEHKANVDRELQDNHRTTFEASKENQLREWRDEIDQQTRAYVATVHDRFRGTYEALMMASQGHTWKIDYKNPDKTSSQRNWMHRKTARQYRLEAEQMLRRHKLFTAAAEKIDDPNHNMEERFSALRIAAQYVPSDFGLAPPAATDIPRPSILDKEWRPAHSSVYGANRGAEHQSTVQALWTRAKSNPDINLILAVCCALIFELATVMCGWVNGLLIAYDPKRVRLTKASDPPGLLEQARARWTKAIPATTQEHALAGLAMLSKEELESLMNLYSDEANSEVKTGFKAKLTKKGLSYSKTVANNSGAWAVLMRLYDAGIADLESDKIVVKREFVSRWLGLVAVVFQSEHQNKD